LSLATKTLIRVLASLLLAAVLLVPLFWYGGVDAADLERTWGRLTWKVYATALLLHVAMYVLRAVRFRVLLPPAERPPFAPLLAVCGAYTMAAFVLPAKIGEASFVLYGNRVCGIGASAGVASLVVSRLLDLATLAGGFAVACFALQASHAYPDVHWFGTAGAGLIAISAVCFFLSARGDVLVRIVTALVRALGLERIDLGRRVLARAEQVAAGLRLAGGEGRLFAATLVSIPIWLSIFLFCAVLARGLGIPEETTLAQATFGSSLAIVTSLIPISAFASFGTLEAGWVLGFGVLGVPHDLAAATGLGLHVVQLANVIAFGVLGHLAMGAWSHRATRTAG